MYTRLNGVILWLGDFMLYDSDDLLSHPNLRELPCKLRGSRQSIPFQRFQDTVITCFVFFTYVRLLKLGQGREKLTIVKPSGAEKYKNGNFLR